MTQPRDPKCDKYKITLSKEIYIEKEDFSEIDKQGFFGLSPSQVIGLKYGPIIKFIKYENNIVYTEIVNRDSNKPKTYVNWISKNDSV